MISTEGVVAVFVLADKFVGAPSLVPSKVGLKTHIARRSPNLSKAFAPASVCAEGA
jgi:hypothetical protein